MFGVGEMAHLVVGLERWHSWSLGWKDGSVGTWVGEMAQLVLGLDK